ncbi:TPA: hypothetical protein N5N95_000723 [Enterobacter bugandensis]|nr:hypothetical protein A3UG_12655 [Enterobacter cloacae subsp. dissolvens SDM]ELC6455680.1 hypothetical protein [Enterobacter hormaechei]ELV2768436.1 hypothetical protein [Enterobacter cloacae]KZP69481.1 hypothetical protein A3N36_00250 [Enterobacter hormaechei subsp. xiangfangensis]HCM9647135.1 hypothetical protein [Enterobacter bugandensis]
MRLPAGRYNENNASFEHDGGNGGGGNMLEARVAKLEADVENIKVNLSEARMDIRELTKSSASIKTDISTVLQKLKDIDEKLSTKASKDFVDSKAGDIKVWMLGLLLLSIAMPIIMFLLNLYLKKP